MRGLVGVLIAAVWLVLLAACATGGADARPLPDLEALRYGGGFPVTRIEKWSSRAHVPPEYVHAVDWHAWSGPVGVAFSGRYVCVLPEDLWTLVQIGDKPAQCRWRAPHGDA